MNNIINQIPFLRTTRDFPEELHQLSVEVNRAYVDIANAVNNRTISLFPTSKFANTGNSYYIQSNLRQQSFRQVYVFTSTVNIPHGINLSQIDRIAIMYGDFTDGTNWYGLIAGSNVAIIGQISFYIDANNIIFLIGAGAPALTKGNIVIEWISQP